MTGCVLECDGGLRQRNAPERRHYHDDQRRRAPYRQQHEPDQRETEIRRRADGARPDGVVERRGQDADHRGVDPRHQRARTRAAA